jgi:tetratricopeptide (TPR) repeat protein
MTRKISPRAVLVLALLVVVPLLVSSLLLINSRTTELPPTPDLGLLDNALIAANIQAGRAMQALYHVEALAAQTGWTHELYMLAGDMWVDMGDLSAAVSYWEAAAQGQPGDAKRIQQLVQAYITLGRWTQATDSLTYLLRLEPENHWAHYQLGLVQAAFDPQAASAHLERVTDYPEYGLVASALRAVLQQNAADPLISMRVGIIFSEQELWSYAELAFQHAAVVGQPFPEALAYIGLARDQQGKDGSDWIEQALALDPQNAQALYIYGLHLRQQANYVASLDALTQSVAHDPQNPAFLAELGTAYRLVGDLQRAEYWLKSAAELSNTDPRFQELLALFYAEEGYNLAEDGLDALERATLLMPNDPDVRASYGWALYNTGETDAALDQIESALAISPDNLRALYYKAQIWLETGNVEGAAPLFEQVAESGSEFAEEARRVLEVLGQ